MNERIYKYCTDLLSKRDYSEQKIADKILSKGLDEFESQKIIQKLKDNNFLNSKRYSTDKIENLAKKGFSIQYIQEKLQEEEITFTPSEIQLILELENINILLIIKSMLDKKLSDYINRNYKLTEQQLVSKAMMFLSSKGYDYYQAVDILPKELYEHIE